MEHRIKLLTHVVCLLLKMVPQQRGYVLREEHAPYRVGPDGALQDLTTNELDELLRTVPEAETKA